MFLNTSVVLKHLVLSLLPFYFIYRGVCVRIYKNVNGPAVLSGNSYKHVWYVELVTCVVTVVCDALPEICFQLLYIFCLI